MWVGGPKRRRDFQGLCSAAEKCCLGFVAFQQSSSRPSLFLLLWGGARGFGRESTRGKRLLCGRQAVRCWAGLLGTCRSVLCLCEESVSATLQLAQRKSQTTQVVQNRFPQLQLSSLFALKSSPKPLWSLPAGIAVCRSPRRGL